MKNRFYDPFQAEEMDAKDTAVLKPYLLYGNNERIVVATSPFLIGKDKAKCDLVLDSKAVSRIHGKITVENEELYYMDNNSTNGSCLNGVRVGQGQKVVLNPEDRICIADVELKFFC